MNIDPSEVIHALSGRVGAMATEIAVLQAQLKAAQSELDALKKSQIEEMDAEGGGE